MGDRGDTPSLVPRLCHIVRWSDFNGYGFNLHAEKGKAGQFIGKVDDGSPAEAAGLKQGDRIVEVNGTNIGNENHQQVVGRIKAGGEETRLLVVDSETDQYYKDEKKVVRGDLPEVAFLTAVRDGGFDSGDQIETPAATVVAAAAEADEPEPAVIASVVSNDTNGDASATPPSPQSDEGARYPARLCHLCKWADFDGFGFNLHAEKDKPGQYIGSVDPNSPAETGGLRENDRIIEVNGDNIETQTHSVVIQKIKAGGDRTSMLVVDKEADDYYKGRGVAVTTSMPHVIVCNTPSRLGETETVTAVVSEPVESYPVPEPETVHNGTAVGEEEEEEEEEIAAPVIDDVTEAVAAVAVDDVEEDVGGGGVEVNAYEEVEVTASSRSYDEDLGKIEGGVVDGEGPREEGQEKTEVEKKEKEEEEEEKKEEEEKEKKEEEEEKKEEEEEEVVVVVAAAELEAAKPEEEATEEEPEVAAASAVVVVGDGAVNASDKPEDDEAVVEAASPSEVDAPVVTAPEVVVAPPQENSTPEAETSRAEEASEAKADGPEVGEEEETGSAEPSQASNGTASNGINSGSVEPEPEPEPTPVAAPEPLPVTREPEPEPEPAVIRSTTKMGSTTPLAVGGDLNLHISAAEMKERLRSRKKQDPRLVKQSFKEKHSQFEKM